MPEIFRIGQMTQDGEQIVVEVEDKYWKAFKGIDGFSHIHCLAVTAHAEMTVISGRADTSDMRKGILRLITRMPLRVNQKDFPLDLIDIKPYIPSEDYVPVQEGTGMNVKIHGRGCDQDSSYEIPYVGEIRNTHGVTYLQYKDHAEMPQSFTEYEHVVWWFDKFDEKKYRRILQCKTPYCGELKVGVFASRAPVRPNPVALTVAKIERIDHENNRVYISGIESYDHTPFLGMLDYDPKIDAFSKEEVNLPFWAQEWPDEVDVEDKAELARKVNEIALRLDAGLKDNQEETETKEQPDRRFGGGEQPTCLWVKGARENNLKGISVRIPYGKITAVVGVSGSGKSSLVMDTVYAECRRRMECLGDAHSGRVRPEMEDMTGCMPAVKISQKGIRSNANSTVGTFSGIYQHLRSVYAAIGKRQFHNAHQVAFEVTPATFSFLDPECRCPVCNGKGRRLEPDINKIIVFPTKSLLEGAIPFLGKLKNFVENPNANWMKGQVIGLAREQGVDLSVTWDRLPEDFKKTVLYGDESMTVTFSYDNPKTGRKGDISRKVEGIVPILNRLYVEGNGMAEKYMSEIPCSACRGEQLAAEGRLITVLGVRYPVAAGMSFRRMRSLMLRMKQELLVEESVLVAEHLSAISSLCNTAQRLGIDYLELDRETAKVSGGEAQRLKLLAAFQNHMSGILYVFDEPSRKLSAHEYDSIAAMMRELVAEGNTVLMVEHNMDMIRNADYVIEIGPGAGAHGGYLIAQGSFEEMVSDRRAMLGRYLRDDLIAGSTGRPWKKEEMVTASHITAHNLLDVSVTFPKRTLTCITGVSGSGKSTLLYQGILPQMQEDSSFEQVVLVESSILGGSSRSVVATYLGVMNEIRALYASVDRAKEKGYTERDFSFNSGRLRCGNCNGNGRIAIPYAEDSYSVCPVCHGLRYAKEAKEIRWNGKTIAQLLEMTALEAAEFFEKRNPLIEQRCRLLAEVGLDYVRLGQGTGELSGGEAARLKIASCLMGKRVKNTLFLLDEPTCGLHYSDIDHLIALLRKIIDYGNTVVVIEHNKRFLAAADYLITMGPGAGAEGGRVLPAQLALPDQYDKM